MLLEAQALFLLPEVVVAVLVDVEAEVMLQSTQLVPASVRFAARASLPRSSLVPTSMAPDFSPELQLHWKTSLPKSSRFLQPKACRVARRQARSAAAP